MKIFIIPLMSLCILSYAAERNVENAMQGIKFSRAELTDAQETLDIHRSAFFQWLHKRRYHEAVSCLKYLSLDEQHKYKQLLLKKALKNNDFELLSLLNDFDTNLLSTEDKRKFDEPCAAKRKKIDEDQNAHQLVGQFDIAQAIVRLDEIPKEELKTACMKIVATISELSSVDKNAAVQYIAEFGPIPLLVLFSSDSAIDMVEILTHVCRIGRTAAVIAILQNTKDILHINKHISCLNYGDKKLKPLRHKRLKPIFIAYKHNHRKIVKILATAFPRLLLYSCDNDPSHTIFYEAIIREDHAFIKELLKLYPRNDKSQKDYSVLQVAAAHGDVQLVDLLLFEDYLPQKWIFLN